MTTLTPGTPASDSGLPRRSPGRAPCMQWARVLEAAPGMTRRERAISAGRDATIGLGVGLAVALLAAAATGASTAAAAGWWDAGYVRLTADAVARRFDRLVLPAAGIGIVATLALGALGVRGRGRAVRPAVALVLV